MEMYSHLWEWSSQTDPLHLCSIDGGLLATQNGTIVSGPLSVFTLREALRLFLVRHHFMPSIHRGSHYSVNGTLSSNYFTEQSQFLLTGM